MQTIADVMTHDVMSVTPQETIRQAAQLMKQLDVGSLPVCDGQRLVGMITDRDIAVRGASTGQEPDDTMVGELMTEEVLHCYDNQSIDEVLEDMGDVQVRRVPVIDHETDMLVGIVSLGDLSAIKAEGVDETLREISAPSEPDRPSLH
jgi:CBS domain-containing protein